MLHSMVWELSCIMSWRMAQKSLLPTLPHANTGRDKEALAIMFGMQYLLGNPLQFCQITNLCNTCQTAILTMASACIPRWALTLSAYDYQIVFMLGKDHAIVVVFSWFPLRDTSKDTIPVPAEVVLPMAESQSSPVNPKQVKKTLDWQWPSTLTCQERSIVRMADKHKRRKKCDCTHDGDGHGKSSYYSNHTRSSVWWPGMDREPKLKVKGCTICQEHQNLPAFATMYPWEWPDHPWARLHADHMQAHSWERCFW